MVEILDKFGLWALRAAWAVMPLTAGAVFDEAFTGSGLPVRSGASIALWVIWSLTLIAMMVPRSETLTALRIVVPAAVPATVLAALSASSDGDLDTALAALGVLTAVAAAVLALSSSIGETFIDGSSYGDERRMPLKVPGPLLLGPLPLAWLGTVAGLTAGPWLLLTRHWILGAVLSVLGFALAAVLIRALHVLTQRWVVFVPAGLVLHDGFALGEPVLFRRRSISSLGPALADSNATDLTSNAVGLALELTLDEPVDLTRAKRGEPATSEPLDDFLFSPSRPGAALAEAQARKLVQ
ncbi:MAG: hypothetical protein V3V01_01000 [Acidimicrobiales bacterium]